MWPSPAASTRILRAYRLSLAHYDPHLAGALHEALTGAGPGAPAAAGHPGSPRFHRQSAVARSFAGALKRSPDHQVAGLVALLELLTFRQALLLAAPGSQAGRQGFERFAARWADRVQQLRDEDPVRLRQRLVQSMRLRLHGKRNGAPSPTHLDAFLQELCGALGRLYGIPRDWP